MIFLKDLPSAHSGVFHGIDGTSATGREIAILGNDYKIPKIYNDNGKPKGILVDIMKYAEKKLDCRFTIKLYPWARAYLLATQGKGGLIGLSKTSERLKIFDYSDVVYYDEVILVVVKGKEFPFETMEDLKGKRLGIGLGGSFGEEFEKAKKAGLFYAIKDDGPVERLHKLLMGGIDAAFISPGRIAFYQTLKKDKKLLKARDIFAILPKPFNRDQKFLGFSKDMKMQPFLKAFNQVLKEGHESGEIDKIIDQYAKLD
ncbi:MAG: amino acid ABC transporter substrate-binding protein [Desulfobacteraceae bacterium]|nr:amino acid ABC transporter substrate-binding protein [Desulfobacteraceae bacterium]